MSPRSAASRSIGAIAALGALWVAAACSTSVAGYPIATGICNACRGKAFTADECAAFGSAAGCITAEMVEPSIEGCSNACSFEHCKTDISCGTTTGGRPGGPPEPCGLNDRGVFETPPSCNEVELVTLGDGGTGFVCRCTDANQCPCGLGCGIIPEIDPNAAVYCTTP